MLSLRFRKIRLPRAHFSSSFPLQSLLISFCQHCGISGNCMRDSVGKTFDLVTFHSRPRCQPAVTGDRWVPVMLRQQRGAVQYRGGGKGQGYRLVCDDPWRSPFVDTQPHTHPCVSLGVMLHKLKSRASGGNSLKPSASSAFRAVIPLEWQQRGYFQRAFCFCEYASFLFFVQLHCICISSIYTFLYAPCREMCVCLTSGKSCRRVDV